jgi:hypothetical protein
MARAVEATEESTYDTCLIDDCRPPAYGLPSLLLARLLERSGFLSVDVFD